MSNPTPTESFSEVLDTLLDESKTFSPKYLHRFSDLEPEDLALLKAAWPRIDTQRRIALTEDLEEISEADSMVYFDDLFELALTDPEPRIRAAGIRMMWDSDNTRFVPALLQFVESDPDEIVRASAAAAMGMFVYQGELEEIAQELFLEVKSALMKVLNGKDVRTVRRRALESLGYASGEDIVARIQEATQSNDKDWVISALFAIGRSADERWSDYVEEMIDHPLDEVKAEAIRAAGEMRIESARYLLLNLLEEPESLDEEVRLSSAWALSQIGGEDVRETLEQLLEDTEDEEEAFLIEQALENLDFTEDLPNLDLLDLDLLDEDHPEKWMDGDVEDLEDSDETPDID